MIVIEYGKIDFKFGCRVRVKLWKMKWPKAAPKSQYDKFFNNPNLKEKYMDSVKNRYEGLHESGNSKCDTFREA